MLFRIKFKGRKKALDFVDDLWRNLALQQIDLFIESSLQYNCFYDENNIFNYEINENYPAEVEDIRLKIIAFLRKQNDIQRKHKIQDYFLIQYFEKSLHHPHIDLDRKVNFLEKLHQTYLDSSLKLRTNHFKKIQNSTTSYINKFISRVKRIFSKKKKEQAVFTLEKPSDEKNLLVENLIRDFEIVLKDLKQKATKAQDKELEKIYLDISKIYNQLATLKNYLQGKIKSDECITEANAYLKRVLYVRSKSQTLLTTPTKYFFEKPAQTSEVEELIFLLTSRQSEDLYKNIFSLNRLLQKNHEISPDGYAQLLAKNQHHLSAEELIEFYLWLKKEAHEILNKMRNSFKHHYLRNADAEATRVLQYALTVTMDLIRGIEIYFTKNNFQQMPILNGDDNEYFHPSNIVYEAESNPFDDEMQSLNASETTLVRTLVESYIHYHGKIAQVETTKKFVYN